MNQKSWVDYIGDVTEGRKNLGNEMPVSIYRLFEFTIKEVLIENYGEEETIKIFHLAGERAGIRFANQRLDLEVDLNQFISQVQKAMKNYKMGLFRLEQIDEEARKIVIAISEDLDCSGLAVSGDTVCDYDEGFIKGLLKAYTNEEYNVVEVDCWANGGRVCRFEATK